jgi:hypothetical protein
LALYTPIDPRSTVQGAKGAARIATHRAIGEAIEHLHPTDLTPHLFQLAHHFREAEVAAKAIDYSIRAGEIACTVLAFEEAALHWRAALRMMDEQGCGDSKRRAHVLFLLGDTLVTPPAQAVEYLETPVQLQEKLGHEEWVAASRMRLALYLVASDLGLMDFLGR